MWNDGNGDWVRARMKRRSYSWLASLRWVKMVDLQDLWDIHTQDYSPSPANRVPLVGSTTPPIIIQMHCIALMSTATHPPTTQSNVHCNMLIKQNNDKNLMQTMKIEICWFAEKRPQHLKWMKINYNPIFSCIVLLECNHCICWKSLCVCVGGVDHAMDCRISNCKLLLVFVHR